jgi:hypothetical protein
MVTDELIRLMRDDESVRWGQGPDLDRIHHLGRRRRALKGLAAGTIAMVTVAVLAGVWWALQPSGGHRTVRSAGQVHSVTGLSAYERNALRQVPGSYAVDGTVVLTQTPRPGAQLAVRVPPGFHLVGEPVPLGFHATVGPGYLVSTKGPRVARVNAPRGSQVVVDAGPVWLGCQGPKHARAGAVCDPVVLAKATDGSFYYLYGLGSDHFLEPGAEMELFTGDDYSDHSWSGTLIGGFHGTSPARVLVDLVDGSVVEADFSAGELSRGNTMFWARVPSPVARVRAFDRDGTLVAEHALRSCNDPVDCEVR